MSINPKKNVIQILLIPLLLAVCPLVVLPAESKTTGLEASISLANSYGVDTFNWNIAGDLNARPLLDRNVLEASPRQRHFHRNVARDGVDRGQSPGG